MATQPRMIRGNARERRRFRVRARSTPPNTVTIVHQCTQLEVGDTLSERLQSSSLYLALVQCTLMGYRSAHRKKGRTMPDPQPVFRYAGNFDKVLLSFIYIISISLRRGGPLSSQLDARLSKNNPICGKEDRQNGARPSNIKMGNNRYWHDIKLVRRRQYPVSTPKAKHIVQAIGSFSQRRLTNSSNRISQTHRQFYNARIMKYTMTPMSTSSTLERRIRSTTRWLSKLLQVASTSCVRRRSR